MSNDECRNLLMHVCMYYANKEMLYLVMRSIHFIYNYMVLDIW